MHFPEPALVFGNIRTPGRLLMLSLLRISNLLLKCFRRHSNLQHRKKQLTLLSFPRKLIHPGLIGPEVNSSKKAILEYRHYFKKSQVFELSDSDIVKV
nr:uncharacterized protein LOC104105359 [Nicotiana tomentosiformis]